MRLALAQINTTVGALDGNREKIVQGLTDARSEGADLVLFPELAVTGYPPEDLLLRPGFVRAAAESLHELARDTRGLTALVGFPHFDGDLYNACAVCAGGEVKARYRKRFLPNYGVFDEDRYFAPGDDLFLLEHGRTLIGPTICEDIWQPGPPATDLALAGAELIANISASPFHVGKDREREEMLVTRARDNACFLAFCNAVGGQDELVFDGHSLVLDDEGTVLSRAPGFEECLLVVDVDPEEVLARRLSDVRRRALARERGTPQAETVHVGSPQPSRDGNRVEAVVAEPLEDLEQMRLALELGLRDYVEKNGFREIVVGVSGGIDSALVAALAAGTLAPIFGEREPDLTEENVQARTRGVLLMALSNKFGWLVVATGNKSELAVGYATLYGDMAGGFALLKDVFKTDVFRLARHLNGRTGRELIPHSILERAPSAELRADQLDEDSLPPYPALDRVLEAYVEEDRSREELTGDGFDRDVVERAIGMIDRAEYKRRQAPPGVKLRPKAFGRDRRTPITNRWRD